MTIPATAPPPIPRFGESRRGKEEEKREMEEEEDVGRESRRGKEEEKREMGGGRGRG